MLWKLVVLVSFFIGCLAPVSASACRPNAPKAETPKPPAKGCLILTPAQQKELDERAKPTTRG